MTHPKNFELELTYTKLRWEYLRKHREKEAVKQAKSLRKRIKILQQLLAEH